MTLSKTLLDLGYTLETFKVVEFLDTKKSSPWWAREHVLLGTVEAVADGGVPARPDAVMAAATRDFGAKAEVIW